MDTNVSTVNAEPEVTVEPQQTEQVETTEQSVNAEQSEVTATEQDGKPVQTREENAHFAEQRRAREQAEQRAAAIERDYSISKTYGAEWGVHSEAEIIEKYGNQGITNLAEFEEAVRRYEMQQKGLDPDTIKQYVDEHPTVKEAKEWKKAQKAEAKKQAEANEFFDLFKAENGREFNPDKDGNFPPKMAEQLRKGKTLADSYAYYLADERGAKLKAKETNKANAESAPGSVTGQGTAGDTLISFEAFEANKNNPEWVRKNFTKINESRAKW